MMKTMHGGGTENTYIYTADDERIWTVDSSDSPPSPWRETFTLRDLDGKVLRVFTTADALDFTNPIEATDDLAWSQDYIYRDGQLLATARADGAGETYHHFHINHLGTPLLITDEEGDAEALHSYFPFGEEIDPDEDSERMKFTRHERDFNQEGETDDLDYMHARYYAPLMGRFLSVDSKDRRRAQPKPQIWNRYAYAAGNSLKYVDPDGEDLKIVYDFSDSGLTEQQQMRVRTGVRGVFVRAGVRNVRSYSSSGSIKPRATKPTDRVVKITITSKSLGEGVYGRTVGSSGKVSTERAPDTPEGRLTFITNVAAHEIGRASGALPQYSADAAPVGSLLNPLSVQPEPGTVMETHISPAEFERRDPSLLGRGCAPAEVEVERRGNNRDAARTKMRMVFVLVSVLLLAVLGALSAWLFRRVTIDNPALGLFTIQYYWGRPATVQIDADRDGTVDGRYVLSSETRYFSPHSRYTEGWESSGCNGAFDLHLRFEPHGELETLEFDSDGSGDYDVILRGAEATQFFRKLQRPDRCNPWQGIIGGRPS